MLNRVIVQSVPRCNPKRQLGRTSVRKSHLTQMPRETALTSSVLVGEVGAQGQKKTQQGRTMGKRVYSAAHLESLLLGWRHVVRSLLGVGDGSASHDEGRVLWGQGDVGEFAAVSSDSIRLEPSRLVVVSHQLRELRQHVAQRVTPKKRR